MILEFLLRINLITSEINPPTIGTRFTWLAINPRKAIKSDNPKVTPIPHASPPIRLLKNISFLPLLTKSYFSSLTLLV